MSTYGGLKTKRTIVNSKLNRPNYDSERDDERAFCWLVLILAVLFYILVFYHQKFDEGKIIKNLEKFITNSYFAFCRGGSSDATPVMPSAIDFLISSESSGGWKVRRLYRRMLTCKPPLSQLDRKKFTVKWVKKFQID